jgi:hypothetical protein
MTSNSPPARLNIDLVVLVAPCDETEGAESPRLGSWTMILAFWQTKSAHQLGVLENQQLRRRLTCDIADWNQRDRLGTPRKGKAKRVDHLLKLIWRNSNFVQQTNVMSRPGSPHPPLMRLHEEVEGIRMGNSPIDHQPGSQIPTRIDISWFAKESCRMPFRTYANKDFGSITPFNPLTGFKDSVVFVG